MTVHPASADYGVWFRRTDVAAADPMVPALWDAVVPSRLCTLVRNAAGTEVSTIEHIMAALAGCGIHNALIEIDGPEVPILDGSAAPFVRGIMTRGLRRLEAPVLAYQVMKAVSVEKDGARAALAPADRLIIDFTIDFADAAIGRQSRAMAMVNGAFVHELSDCRTFCRRVEVEAMRASGLALGGSLDNAVVVEGDRVLNPGGFRRVDECVRHKMLDAVGDLALAGAPILGAYRGVRAGHGLTNRLLRRLFATEGAWEEVVIDAATARRLPGAGLGMADLRRAG